VGDCSTAGLQAAAIGYGQTAGPDAFSLGNYMIGSDAYDINISSYGATYLSGTYIFINFSATYIGVNPSTSADTIEIDELQDFYSNIPGTWDSPPNYTEDVPVLVGSGTTFAANLCYNGGSSTVCVGQVGPVGAGTYDLSLSSSLIGLGGGDYLSADFGFILNFPAGTASGTTIDAPASLVPEPAETIPVALALAGFVSVMLLRSDETSVKEEQ
jgi:hypothetical protein